MSCGGTSSQWQTPVRGAELHGAVYVGQRPLNGAAIELFASSTQSDGSASTPLLAKAVKSDANGEFTIAGDYDCPSSSTLLYVTATGGNPGLAAGADNASAALMRTLGPCSSLGGVPAISINEMTTAASVVPLIPFMTSYRSVGAAQSETAQLSEAFRQVDHFLLAREQAAPVTETPGTSLAKTANLIAETLLPCLESAGGLAHDGSTCGRLFGETESETGRPVTETIGAALELARNAGMNPDNLGGGGSALVAAAEESPIRSMQTSAYDETDAPISGPNVSVAPPNSVFTPPAPNACQSRYDKFYEAESGVYAYWALCEAGSPMQIYDYVGQYDLATTTTTHPWGSGVISGGAPGPVSDGETGATIPSPNAFVESQGVPLNTHQGTVSAWINGSARAYPQTAVFFGAVSARSTVAISISGNTPAGMAPSTCFLGTLTNSLGTPFITQSCGYAANTWHRVTLTWQNGNLVLFVDGVPVSSTPFTGALDNAVFYYKLFPGCCNTGLPLSMAKVLLANRAWSATAAADDFSPKLTSIPSGGVYVSTTKLGTIHRDVLGFADYSQDISTPALTNALVSGATAAGFTSLRYSGGRGFKMDLEDWQAPTSCGTTPGAAAASSLQSPLMQNTIDNYLPQIAQPLGADVVYTVNYGSNPPFCNAGGDPVANGANLVQYANLAKGYGIKHWEIGNELFTNHSTDFHPNPNTGASYVTYEPPFYSSMKAQDPTIKIGVPVGLTSYADQAIFDLPVMGGAKYDAIIWHNYPMKDPITDGATIYQDRVASNMRRTRGELLTLQTELMNNGKNPDSIWITEWDANVSGNQWSKQTMGAVMPIFAATQLAEYMQAGVQLATWWAQGGTDVCSTLNYDGDGETAYSWWECGMGAPIYTGSQSGVGEVSVGLKPGDLTPAARAFQVLSQSGFVTEGEHMVQTETDSQNAPWLLSYAATHGSSYAVILINRDRDNAHTLPVLLRGWTSGHAAQQWTYGRTQYDNSRSGNWSVGPTTSSYGAWTGNFQAVLPPWSVNVIVFTR